MNLSGVAGGFMTSSLGHVQLMIGTLDPKAVIQATAHVVRRIEVVTPSRALGTGILAPFRGFKLADPNFSTPRRVDLILGADTASAVIRPGVIHRGNLVAQRTAFGWVVTGGQECVPGFASLSLTTQSEAAQETCCDQLAELVHRFWAMEEVPQVHRISKADEECESLYAQNHSRDSSGRYIVSLPVRTNALDLVGDSLNQARRALTSAHRRMERDTSLREHYVKFMKEYLQLGHMRLIPPQELENHNGTVVYLPHHAIWQRSDGGRRLRVVFNASSPTSTGVSLNDALYPGPKLQNNIAVVITRWRRYKIAFCADIKMMYRQIRVREKDVHLQRVIWSESREEPEAHYALLTVTYGESSAPYLALRTLQQLCKDEGVAYPEAVDAIHDELYVDDVLTGADSETDARRRRDQIIELLRAGGFKLKKWVSNTPSLLDDLPAEDRLRPSWLHFTTDGPVKELGLAWDPSTDNFRFAPPAFELADPSTKRRVLAEMAKLFDPAGWLAPIVIIAKMFIQDLWRAKLTWDEILPTSMAQRWASFKTDLAEIAHVTIPRWFQSASHTQIQLHVFADASRRALAAAAYVRVVCQTGQIYVNLVSPKTKLTPIRSLRPSKRPAPRMTIPRLELRAALLAARLLHAIAPGLKVSSTNCFLWSDSSTVLYWLSSSDPIGNDLVDNYIHHIQELLPTETWNYVPSLENPADIATRGMEPPSLKRHPLWWNGPSWLAKPPDTWPLPPPRSGSPSEAESSYVCATCTATETTKKTFIEGFSSLLSLLRGVARSCRYISSLNKRSPCVTPILSPLTAKELRLAFLDCVRLSQSLDFPSEINELRAGRPVKVLSPLRKLNPFLDDAGVLRVGGRLDHSQLTYDEKHPPLLSGKSHLAGLVIDWAHQRALHAGIRSTSVHVMRKAWIIGGAPAIRRRVHSCLACARMSGRPMTQAMAPLPAARVSPSRPFSKVGVDYAGPFQILRSRGRGISSTKGYAAIFVCLCTKAIHIELVGDLTTASFLGALSRFVGRRGKPKEIWCDNATNFRGADHELRRLINETEHHWDLVAGRLAEDGINWRFIPPSAPHFGGLWEAGVKAMKAHLCQVIGTRKLTFEEMSTLLVQIEMVLNCRPLGPITGDVEDLDILTPAHFLVGCPLTALPSAPLDENLDRLTRWDRVKGMRDALWRRYSREYLNTLQQRGKWTRKRKNLAVGDLVAIIDPSLLTPFGKWPLGRVVAVRPGRDGLVRAAHVKTAVGEYLRPIAKLTRLPFEDAPASAPSDREDSLERPDPQDAQNDT